MIVRFLSQIFVCGLNQLNSRINTQQLIIRTYKRSSLKVCQSNHIHFQKLENNPTINMTYNNEIKNQWFNSCDDSVHILVHVTEGCFFIQQVTFVFASESYQ